MFKSHLEMIGRNETPSKKAKFWQSYIRSLKGSEDIRAHETPRAARPYSSYLDAPGAYRSIFAEPETANERVQSHGYRYLPVSRDTYGYSPRAIYDHHYSRTIPANYEAEKAWNDHLKRMQEIERKYPSRWGLYLRDKPTTTNPIVPLEYEPEDKLLKELNKERSPSLAPNRVSRAGSEPYVPPPSYWSKRNNEPTAADRAAERAADRAADRLAERAASLAPIFERATSLAPFERASSLAPFERAASLAPLWARPLFRASSLEPLDELLPSKFDKPSETGAPADAGHNQQNQPKTRIQAKDPLQPEYYQHQHEPHHPLNQNQQHEHPVAPKRAQSLAPPSTKSNPRHLGIFERSGTPTPTPIKVSTWAPRPTEVAYDAEGRPLLFPRNRLRDMLEPNPYAPISAFVRDPFWWDIDDLAPFRSLSVPRFTSPPIARDSFLSPVKNRYLWAKHPARPLTPAIEEAA